MSPLKTKRHGNSAAMVTNRDNTLHKHMMKAIRASANNFKRLAENASDGIMIAVENGSIVYVNNRLSEITGYYTHELRGLRIEDICHPGEAKKNSEREKLRLKGIAVPSRYETIFIKKDRVSVLVELSVSKTLWFGKPAVLRIIRDITQRKRIEGALGKMNNELEKHIYERTKEMLLAAEKLERNENDILKHKIDLEKANKELVQTNTALSVLARNIDKKKDEVEKKFAQTVNSQIIPIVEEIQSDKIPESSRVKLEVLTAYLNDLTPATAKDYDILTALSNMELRVALMIKNGFSSNDIARLLHISPHTVKTHRRNIRAKLNIKNSNINLMSYLRLKLGKVSSQSLTLQ